MSICRVVVVVDDVYQGAVSTGTRGGLPSEVAGSREGPFSPAVLKFVRPPLHLVLCSLTPWRVRALVSLTDPAGLYAHFLVPVLRSRTTITPTNGGSQNFPQS